MIMTWGATGIQQAQAETVILCRVAGNNELCCSKGHSTLEEKDTEKIAIDPCVKNLLKEGSLQGKVQLTVLLYLCFTIPVSIPQMNKC